MQCSAGNAVQAMKYLLPKITVFELNEFLPHENYPLAIRFLGYKSILLLPDAIHTCFQCQFYLHVHVSVTAI